MIGLVEMRRKEGLTQEALSEKIGVSKAALSHYEKGRREPNLETLKKMAQFFNCTIDDLV